MWYLTFLTDWPLTVKRPGLCLGPVEVDKEG